MTSTRKIETIQVPEDVHTDRPRQTLHAGTYRVEMPAGYDADLVTGEDILLDGDIVIEEMTR